MQPNERSFTHQDCCEDCREKRIAARSIARCSAHLDILGRRMGRCGARARHSPRYTGARHVISAARLARVDRCATLVIHRIRLRSCVLSRVGRPGRARPSSRQCTPRRPVRCGDRRCARKRPTQIGARRSDGIRVWHVCRRMRRHFTRNRLPRPPARAFGQQPNERCSSQKELLNCCGFAATLIGILCSVASSVGWPSGSVDEKSIHDRNRSCGNPTATRRARPTHPHSNGCADHVRAVRGQGMA
jgi:hypothetical protein